MALKSMTGFGRGEASAHGLKVEAELSSVNRKQFDLRLTLPRVLSALEPQVNALVHASISRGCVMGTLKVSVSGTARRESLRIDRDLARAGVKALRDMAAELGMHDDLGASALLALPDVVNVQQMPEDADALWPLVQRAVRAALRKLVTMRGREGAALQEDMDRRIGRLVNRAEQIGRLAPRVPVRYRENLHRRLSRAGVDLRDCDPQIAREVAMFAERCDIAEELVRLASHLAQAQKLMQRRGAVGRTLDFLCQEMFREVNTIGSKASDGAVSSHVVAFKAELEAVREQVQNVE